MSLDEKYALNWSSHADHLKQAFDKILEANDFVDVTLSCEGRKIKAHRVILSACSSYFYDVLKDNPCSHPTIVLRDIKYNNIYYLLKFMYCGEVQVPTEHFSSFLETAELLEISGLTGTNNPTGTKNSPTTEDISMIAKSTKFGNATNKRKNSDDKLECKKKKDSNLLDTDENLSESDSKEADNEVNNVMKSVSVENIPNIQKLLSDNTYLSKDSNPECECPVCAEKFSSIYLLKQHIHFHMGGTKCQICDRVMTRVDTLKKHLATVHKIPPNSCKKLER